MEFTQNLFLTGAAILLCACVAQALPAARQDDMDGTELSHLVSLIGTLKNLDTTRNADTADNWALLDNADDDTAQSLSAEPASSSSADKLAALRQGFLGFNKRQWSYDYGLGGGRFGKRYYGDYGIGGGRFGRDVDHVDVADTNDASL